MSRRHLGAGRLRSKNGETSPREPWRRSNGAGLVAVTPVTSRCPGTSAAPQARQAPVGRRGEGRRSSLATDRDRPQRPRDRPQDAINTGRLREVAARLRWAWCRSSRVRREEVRVDPAPGLRRAASDTYPPVLLVERDHRCARGNHLRRRRASIRFRPHIGPRRRDCTLHHRFRGRPGHVRGSGRQRHRFTAPARAPLRRRGRLDDRRIAFRGRNRRLRPRRPRPVDGRREGDGGSRTDGRGWVSPRGSLRVARR